MKQIKDAEKIDDVQAAACMEAMGHPKRLAVYRLLVKAGPDGMTMGRIQEMCAIPASTLNHHVSALVRAGLVVQERSGREIRCTNNSPVMWGVVDYLTAECCSLSCDEGTKK
ncbi:MAG: helix-turn-helix transcriptional regulator [Rhodospirillales bacterium]|jgi:ArsR family transcriptional regulator, arsenate/arsenite/antimonite-responsive transcriptional repressor|nr:helix-turn-helix transcriptional regulator [Rhodospirillales bacterium]